LPENQYHVYHPSRGPHGWLGKDYRSDVEKLDVPVIVHEMGQWCVYPNFDEAQKYTGPLKPKNFDIFRDSLMEHGMLTNGGFSRPPNSRRCATRRSRGGRRRASAASIARPARFPQERPMGCSTRSGIEGPSTRRIPALLRLDRAAARLLTRLDDRRRRRGGSAHFGAPLENGWRLALLANGQASPAANSRRTAAVGRGIPWT
jgi:hypothetical protein